MINFNFKIFLQIYILNDLVYFKVLYLLFILSFFKYFI